MGWGQACRLRHVTSGRYLAATGDNQVVTFHRNAAAEDATAFIVRQSKVQSNVNFLLCVLSNIVALQIRINE